MNVVARRLLVVVLIAITLLFVVPWGLFSIFRDDIRLRVEKVIDRRLEAEVTFDDIGLTLLEDFPNVTLTLNEVTIAGRGEFSGDTLAHVGEFDLVLKTASLLFGNTTDLKSIHLHDPDIKLRTNKGGSSNFNIFKNDTVQTASSEERTIDLSIDELLITNGDILYDDARSGTIVNVRGVEHTGKGDFDKEVFDFATLTQVEDISVDYEGIRYLANKEMDIDLVMELDLQRKKFTVKRNAIHINHFGFTLDGSVGSSGQGYDMDVALTTQETDFKNIVSLIPGVFKSDFKHLTTRGELIFNGFVKGRYESGANIWPSFSTTLMVKDGWFKIDTLPDPIENIRLKLDIHNLTGNKDSTVVDLSGFSFDMKEHLVSGNLKLLGSGRYIDANIKADMDLSELERMYPLHGLDLKGMVDFELRARGPIQEGMNGLERLPVFFLNLRLKDGRVKYDHLPGALENVHFHLIAENPDGRPESSVFDFRAIHMDLGKNTLHGFLKTQGYKNIKVTSELKSDLDLADLETMYPMDSITMKGHLSVDLKSDGVFNKDLGKFPAVDAQVELTNGQVLTKHYPSPIDNIHLSGELINATGAFSDTHMTIRRLTYNLDDEPFEVRGTIADLDKYDYDLQIKGLVNLEKIARIYPIPGLRMEGIIISDVETRGRLSDLEEGRYEKTYSDGKVEVRDLVIISPSVRNRIAVKTAQFTLSPTKVIIESLEGKLGKSRVSLTGDLFNYMAFATRNNDLVKCDLVLKADTLDINEWVDGGISRPGVKGDTAGLTLWEVPQNLDLTFDSEIDNVFYDDIHIRALDGEIRIKDGVMTLHETGFNTLDARFNLSGDYDTRDMDHPGFDMDLKIRDLDINKAYKELRLVRELASAAADTYGKFSLDYKLKGELKKDFSAKTETLVGGGEVRIQDAKINGMKIFDELSKASKRQEVNDPHLRDFVVKTEVRDNKIIVKPFSIRVSGMDADIEGVSEINGALRYLVKLEILHMKIPFHVTGTYDNPKVTIGKGHVLQPTDSLAN